MRIAPYRAATRIGRRHAWQAPGRSAIIAALIAVPICGLTAAAIIIRTAVPAPEDRVRNDMGSADLAISASIDGPGLLNLLPSGSSLVERRTIESSTIIRGRHLVVTLVELSPSALRSPAVGLFHLVRGRLPASAGEAALQPHVLGDLAAQIGDRVRFSDHGLTLRVTGTVVQPERLTSDIALLGPGTLSDSRTEFLRTDYLVGLPGGASRALVASQLSSLSDQLTVTTRESAVENARARRRAATAGSFAATAIALIASGLVVGAAFVVGTRRQLRTLGLLGAVGGEPRHMLAVVSWGGTVLGAVGSGVGVGLGILASFIVHPHLNRFADRIVGPVRMPIVPLLGAIALGTLASTIAALTPARSAARISTIDALAGRMRPPRPPGRLAAKGAAIAASGSALVLVATAARSGPLPALGFVLTFSGFLVAIPLLVTWMGRVGRALPTIPRIAARDLSRNGRRTATALAAASIALALPVGIGALTLSQDASERVVPFMEADQLSIGFFDGLVRPHEGDAGHLVANLRAAFPGSLVVPLGIATKKNGKEELPVWIQGPRVKTREGTSRVSGSLIIGDHDVLRAFHAEDGTFAFRAGRVVSVGPASTIDGEVYLTTNPGEEPSRANGAIKVSAVEAGRTRYASLGPSEYKYIISSVAAARLNLVVNQESLSNPLIVLRAPTSLSNADIKKAREIASRFIGASVYSKGDLGSNNAPGRWAFGIGGAVFALAIVAIIVSLVAAESRRDRVILVAVGASARTMRAYSGASAGMIAGLAGALAVPTGFVPVVLFRVAQTGAYPIVVPWAAIGLSMFLIPFIAGGAAAIASREPMPKSLLRPTE